jgi:hypothetical protein
MSQTNCSNITTTDKTTFNWITDSNSKTKVNCLDFTPPFLHSTLNGQGISTINVDVENDLKGIVRKNTRCSMCKFQPGKQWPQSNLPTCNHVNKIRPNGYMVYLKPETSDNKVITQNDINALLKQK